MTKLRRDDDARYVGRHSRTLAQASHGQLTRPREGFESRVEKNQAVADQQRPRRASLLNHFEALQADEIVWQGLKVRKAFRRAITREQVFDFEFLRATSDPVQRIVLGLRGGELELLGQRAKHFGLWRDTAPDRFGVRAIPAEPDAAAELVVWNEWRLRNGSVFAHLGNAGIVTTESETSVELRCSDGEGQVDFDDLVVRLTF